MLLRFGDGLSLFNDRVCTGDGAGVDCRCFLRLLLFGGPGPVIGGVDGAGGDGVTGDVTVVTADVEAMGSDFASAIARFLA